MRDAPLDDHDDQLLTELAGLWNTLDPVPDDLADESRFAITVHSLEAELAELQATETVAVRGHDDPDAGEPERWTFSNGDVSLLVTTDARSTGEDRVTVDGWVTEGGVRVEVHAGSDVLRVTADEDGRFVVEGVPRGRVWFVVHGRTGAPVVTTPPIEL